LKKRPKDKAVAFPFRPFLATYFIFEKEAKNSKKVRLLLLLFIQMHDLFTGIARI
jgi:hypothetical protein